MNIKKLWNKLRDNYLSWKHHKAKKAKLAKLKKEDPFIYD